MTDIRTTETRPGTTTIIEERRGSGGSVLIALVLLLAVIVGSWYLYATAGANNGETDAVAGASKSVGTAADKVGDAASGSSR